MAKNKGPGKKPIEQYDHKGKERLNNPPVGLVTPELDRESPRRQYAYDPHLDPALQWAGKAEHTSMLVLEVKGQDTQQDQTKRVFLDEWVHAVNEHGGFGKWRWAVSKNPADIAAIIQETLAKGN